MEVKVLICEGVELRYFDTGNKKYPTRIYDIHDWRKALSAIETCDEVKNAKSLREQWQIKLDKQHKLNYNEEGVQFDKVEFLNFNKVDWSAEYPRYSHLIGLD